MRCLIDMPNVAGTADGRWMMSRSSEKNPGSPSSFAADTAEALAQHHYNQAVELERKLRTILQSKGTSDPHVRELRNTIRESYEAVILENHEFADSHDVEPALWRLHYKQIEEFRSRIRKSVSAAAAAASAPVIPMPGAKVVPRREPVHKVLAVFKSFLAEATGFYHDLILKLRAKYGLPQEYWSYDMAGIDDMKPMELNKCLLSCHRCLIYLGDLSRYKELHTDGDLRSHDWSVAAGYYLKAVSLWPTNGNPHNQLAVLATYVGDELLAVYRYCRSLAVDNPFLTARDNLILLFEKNRQYYAQLSPAASEITMPLAKMGGPKVSEKTKITNGDKMLPVGDGVVKLAVKDYNRHAADSKGLTIHGSEKRKFFRIRFVRLNGILFTRTSLEMFPEVYSTMVRDLEQLLAADDASLEAGLGSDHRSGIGTGSSGAAGVVQLVSILIFTVHNVNWGANANHPTYAEVLQRSALFQHAFTAAFECAGRIMRRCAETRDLSGSSLLPAMLVFTEWLASRPEIAGLSDLDEQQANARSFFWKQHVTLLNRISEEEKDLGAVTGNLESSMGLSLMDDVGEGEGGVALWEDFELQGFVPLGPAHLALDYSKRPPRSSTADKKEKQVRVQRLWAAGKAIANDSEGRGEGILFDEDTGKFHLSWDKVEKERVRSTNSIRIIDSPNNETARDLDLISSASSRLATTSVKNGLAHVTSKERQSSAVVLPAKPISGEEDEEVIVFKPLLKENDPEPYVSGMPIFSSGEVSVVNTAAIKPKMLNLASSTIDANTQYNKFDDTKQVTLKSFQSAPTSDKAAHDTTPNLLPSERIKTTKGNMEPSLAPARLLHSLNGGSSLVFSTPFIGLSSSSGGIAHAELSTLHKDKDITGMSASYSPSLSGTISPQDWLNHTGISSAGFANSCSGNWSFQAGRIIPANGFKKVPELSGITGHPNEVSTSGLQWSVPSGISECNNLFNGNVIQGIMKNGPMDQHNFSDLTLDTQISATEKCMTSSIMPEPSSFTGPFSTKSYVNGKACEKPQNGVIGRPNSSMPEGKGNIMGEGCSPVSLNSSFLSASSGPTTSVATNLWASGNFSSILSGSSVIRPPPGFGPLPMKPAINGGELLKTSKANFDGQQAIEADEQQQLDDYSWLDDYTSLKPEPMQEKDSSVVSSAFSADYSIWSSGLDSQIGSNLSVLPFPGMRTTSFRNSFDPQLQLQKQTMAIPPQQQLLKELQTKKESTDLEQQGHLYGIQQSIVDGQNHFSKQQQLLLWQKHQQQLWYGQYCAGDPFVS